MSHIDTGGGGGRRRVNIELNLVPFIDLMSVLITFLLITAVWTHVSMLQIGSSVYGKKVEGQKVEIPPSADIVLRLDIKNEGYWLTVGANRYPIYKLNGTYNSEALFKHLTDVKEQYPQKIDGIITMSDELPYEELIRGMDTFLQASFPQIAIAAGGPK